VPITIAVARGTPMACTRAGAALDSVVMGH
jgi:hypothetical protein